MTDSSMLEQQWAELARRMRVLRQQAGLSLRVVEARGRWARGTLSQAETGRSRPSAELVWFYEDLLGADGLLISAYVAARAGSRPDTGRTHWQAGEPVAFQVLEACPPGGTLVRPGATVRAGWVICNQSDRTWRDWSLVRLGPPVGPRLLGGPAVIDVPVGPPGSPVRVSRDLVAPDDAGATVASFALVDGHGMVRSPRGGHLTVSVLVSDL